MASSPEQLFESLNSSTGILALIGGTEDLHLDCKVWPTKDEEAQRMIAKAACGFANGDGGVIVVGMKAKAGLFADLSRPRTARLILMAV